MTALNTPAANRLRDLLERVGGRYRVRVKFSSSDSAEKIDHLKRTGRDFLAETDQLRRAVTRAVMASIRENAGRDVATVEQAMREAAEFAAREHLIKRFRQGGYDISLTPLRRGYKAWKERAGYSDLIGVMTWALYTDLTATAEVTLERVA